MDSLNNIFEKLNKNKKINVLNKENADYMNPLDNLIYCGKCNTPKQAKLKLDNGEKKIFPTNCKCRQKEIDKQNQLEKERKHIQIVDRLKSNGISDKALLDWNFKNDNGSLEKIYLAKNYVNHWEEVYKNNYGLILFGEVGTGKTYFASCIANALIEKEIIVKMTNFAKILNDMMNIEIDKNSYISNLNRNQLLIIDDLGMERDTPFALEHVYNIIDSRYKSNKPLIVTTNLTLKQLQYPSIVAYKRIYSRVLEVCTPIQFTGKNLRAEKMEQKRKSTMSLLQRK